jgi:hypothetical protein
MARVTRKQPPLDPLAPYNSGAPPEAPAVPAPAPARTTLPPLSVPLMNAGEAQTLLTLLDAAGRHLGADAFAPCAEFAGRIKASLREHVAITNAAQQIMARRPDTNGPALNGTGKPLN